MTQHKKCKRARIALVVPGLECDGGVPESARFVVAAMERMPAVDVTMFSLPLWSRAETSTRLISPATWRRGPTTAIVHGIGRDAVELGATIAELEPLRYASNALRRHVLSQFDLVQVVAGIPAWANAAAGIAAPVLLHVATTYRMEKEAIRHRGDPLRRVASTAYGPVMERMDRRGLRLARHVFAMNLWLTDETRTVRGDDAVTLAPPGVDADLFRPAKERAQRQYVFAVARWKDVRKRLDLLIEAFALTAKAVALPIDLLLAGPEEPDAGVYRLAELLGVRDRIRYTGMLSRAELASHYREAAIAVCSSDEEGYGLTMVEAMASGIPVVATRCGGPEYTVVDGVTGALVPRGNAVELSKAMTGLLRDEGLRERMGIAGRARVLAEFSDDRCAARFISTWNRHLGRNGLEG